MRQVSTLAPTQKEPRGLGENKSELLLETTGRLRTRVRSQVRTKLKTESLPFREFTLMIYPLPCFIDELNIFENYRQGKWS